MAKPKRKSLTETVKQPPRSVPKVEVDLEGLDQVTGKLPAAAPAAKKKARKNNPKPKSNPARLRRLSVDLDEDLLAKFKAWCAVNHTTIKKRVVELISEAVDRA